MKKIILLTLIFISLASKGQTTINITSNTIISGGFNDKEYHISEGITLTINGSVTNYNSGKFVLLGCNSKLDIIGSFTGKYTKIDIERYCDDCTNLVNLQSTSATYDNGYLSVNGSIDFTDVSCVTPLPVELISLNCNNKNIKWSTGAEINNSHFVIEYSTNAINWESKGIVLGQGNTTELTNYQYNINNNGYYRLCQTDYDGTNEYSKILYCGNINKANEVKLIGTYDLLGQEIPSNFKGVAIKVYSDGSISKIMMQ